MPPRANAPAPAKPKRAALAHKKQDALFIEVLSIDPPRGGERDGQMARGDEYWAKVTSTFKERLPAVIADIQKRGQSYKPIDDYTPQLLKSKYEAWQREFTKKRAEIKHEYEDQLRQEEQQDGTRKKSDTGSKVCEALGPMTPELEVQMGSAKWALFSSLWPILGSIARCDMNRVDETALQLAPAAPASGAAAASAGKAAASMRQPPSSSQPQSGSAVASSRGGMRSAVEATATSPNKQPSSVLARKHAQPAVRPVLQESGSAARDASDEAAAAAAVQLDAAAPAAPARARSQRKRKARHVSPSFMRDELETDSREDGGELDGGELDVQAMDDMQDGTADPDFNPAGADDAGASGAGAARQHGKAAEVVAGGGAAAAGAAEESDDDGVGPVSTSDEEAAEKLQKKRAQRSVKLEAAKEAPRERSTKAHARVRCHMCHAPLQCTACTCADSW